MTGATRPRINGQLATTLEAFITSVARDVAQAQLELDRSSITIQQSIDADATLVQHGVKAAWYQMPETQLSAKVALSVQSTAGAPQVFTSGAAAGATEINVWPVDARYQNLFRYDVNAASTLTVKIVTVPPG